MMTSWTWSWYDSEHHDVEMLTSENLMLTRENLIQCRDAQPQAQWPPGEWQAGPGSPGGARRAGWEHHDVEMLTRENLMLTRENLPPPSQ
jgi:hypothetical protein